MANSKHRASRLASGDWDYRGFIISQDYRTKRWLILKDDCLQGTPVRWVQTLRSAKRHIDDLSSHKENMDEGTGSV